MRTQVKKRSPGAKSWSVGRYRARPGKNCTASLAMAFQVIWRAFWPTSSRRSVTGSIKLGFGPTWGNCSSTTRSTPSPGVRMVRRALDQLGQIGVGVLLGQLVVPRPRPDDDLGVVGADDLGEVASAHVLSVLSPQPPNELLATTRTSPVASRAA